MHVHSGSRIEKLITFADLMLGRNHDYLNPEIFQGATGTRFAPALAVIGKKSVADGTTKF